MESSVFQIWIVFTGIILSTTKLTAGNDWMGSSYPNVSTCFTGFPKGYESSARNEEDMAERECGKLKDTDLLRYKVCTLRARFFLLSKEYIPELDPHYYDQPDILDQIKLEKVSEIRFSIYQTDVATTIAYRFAGINYNKFQNDPTYQAEYNGITERMQKCEAYSFTIPYYTEDIDFTIVPQEHRENWEKLVNCIEAALAC